jgi:predicted Fe-S protein YdhL (DUF1289 family)
VSADSITPSPARVLQGAEGESGDVPSPCTNVCIIDPRSGYCTGCARTLDEISRWPSATRAEKQAILDALPARKLHTRP